MMTSLWAVSAADALHWWEMYVVRLHVRQHVHHVHNVRLQCRLCMYGIYTQQSRSCDCDLIGSGKRLIVDFTEETVAFGIGGLDIC